MTNKIYNNNSLEILDNMISNELKVDLIVTDPPYLTTSRGSSGNSGGMLQKDINKKGKVFDNNNTHVSEWGVRIYNVLKDTGHCYIMTNHKNLQEYINVLTKIGFNFIKSLIWVKDNKIMGQYYMGQFEYILFFRKGSGVKINNCGTSDVLHFLNKKSKGDDGKNLHDTEKPIGLIQLLIENSSKENEVVLDPFMGIGTTCIASILSNRKYIGIDIDENYFKIAENRINKTIMEQSQTFAPLKKIK